MKSLLLITHGYPINNSEDDCFIKNEIPFIYRYFEKIYILSLFRNINNEEILNLPNNVIFYIFDKYYSKVKKLITSIIILLNPIFYYELILLIKNKNISIKKIFYCISYLRDGILLKKNINKILNKDKNINLIYTFWFLQETLSALLIKKERKNIYCITRAHGYDVHEFQNSLKYQPFKYWMDKKIDKIFFASQYLCDYYLKTFAKSNINKYIPMPLGLINNKTSNVINKKRNMNTFILCSCSYIIPRKRINFIIEALNQINDFNIHWIHIGNGPDMENIISLSYSLLHNKNNISFEFKGFMTSEQVMIFYEKNHIDCFITTADMEGGRPVSISEAMSFGIPVIATNTGGIPELVKDIGILLDNNCKISEIRKAITNFYNLSEIEKNNIRHSTRCFWENNCKAETNYTNFIKELGNLIN